MQKNEIPGFVKKRKLLYYTKDASQLAKHGDTFLESGQIDDAVDFYEMAKNEAGLKKVLDISKKEGNLYLYRKICRLLKIEPDKSELSEIGTKAMELGKLTMALGAFKAAENGLMLAKVEGLLGQSQEDKKSQ